MYAYIRGKLAVINPLDVVIDVNGIGFHIHTHHRVIAQLPQLEAEVCLHTSFQVREAAQTLYGFLLTEEKELFERLIGISGIGPKHALGLIGTLSLAELAHVVSQRDVNALKRVPGIGKKTAERLLIELQDKLPALTPQQLALNLPKEKQHIRDAVAALINLGYTQSTAQKAVKTALENHPEETDLSLIITKALSVGR
ncbi:MAG: Holliday junction branch migration protein RuvA [Chlamydiia bacterium]|nr:Holliday junction branch migration protein RuvA [Chlamydiia bacterium]